VNHYGLCKYKIVILTVLTYSLAGVGVGLGLEDY